MDKVISFIQTNSNNSLKRMLHWKENIGRNKNEQ